MIIVTTARPARPALDRPVRFPFLCVPPLAQFPLSLALHPLLLVESVVVNDPHGIICHAFLALLMIIASFTQIMMVMPRSLYSLPPSPFSHSLCLSLTARSRQQQRTNSIRFYWWLIFVCYACWVWESVVRVCVYMCIYMCVYVCVLSAFCYAHSNNNCGYVIVFNSIRSEHSKELQLSSTNESRNCPLDGH